MLTKQKCSNCEIHWFVCTSVCYTFIKKSCIEVWVSPRFKWESTHESRVKSARPGSEKNPEIILCPLLGHKRHCDGEIYGIWKSSQCFLFLFLFSGVEWVLGCHKLVDLSGLNKRHPPPYFAMNTMDFLWKTSQNNRI